MPRAKKRAHPVVNGVETTYRALAKALSITQQGALHRYRLAEGIYGKGQVKIKHISQPVVPPDRGMLRMLKAEQERNLKIVKFAMLHGPTHASLHFKMPVKAIKGLLHPDKL